MDPRRLTESKDQSKAMWDDERPTTWHVQGVTPTAAVVHEGVFGSTNEAICTVLGHWHSLFRHSIKRSISPSRTPGKCCPFPGLAPWVKYSACNGWRCGMLTKDIHQNRKWIVCWMGMFDKTNWMQRALDGNGNVIKWSVHAPGGKMEVIESN